MTSAFRVSLRYAVTRTPARQRALLRCMVSLLVLLDELVELVHAEYQGGRNEVYVSILAFEYE